jgi:hypothetical protein
VNRSRAEIEANIQTWRQSLEAYAKELQPVALQAIEALEVELAALDSGPPDAAGPAVELPAPRPGRQSHRKPQEAPRGRGCDAFNLPTSRLAAVLGSIPGEATALVRMDSKITSNWRMRLGGCAG